MNFPTLRGAWIVSIACLCVMPICTRGAEPPAPLKIQVEVPASWQTIAGDDVQQAISQELVAAFAQCGLSQPASPLRSVEDPTRMPNLLTVHLTDQSINREGGLAFAFTATLRTPNDTREFGPFAAVVDNWLSRTRPLDLGGPLAAATDRALRDLCEDVVLTQLRTNPLATLSF